MRMLHAFFEGARQGRLHAIRCARCAELAFPPKESCSSCRMQEWESVQLAGTGTITSFRVISVSQGGPGGEAPYAVAQVRLTEGVSLVGRIVGLPLQSITVGQTVRFRPLVEPGQTAIGFGPAS